MCVAVHDAIYDARDGLRTMQSMTGKERWTESETGTDSRETETTQRDAQTNACLIFFSASSPHGSWYSPKL